MEKVKDMQFTRHIYEMQDDTPALGFYLNECHYVVREQTRDKMCVRVSYRIFSLGGENFQ